MSNVEPVPIAILAKAPIPGLAKTRLAASLGLQGAARLQERLIVRTLETACAAATGPVRLWAAPDESHFRELAARFHVDLAAQPDADLGARMLAAFAAARPSTRSRPPPRRRSIFASSTAPDGMRR